MATTPEKKHGKGFIYAIAGIGTVFGVWALVAFTSLLSQMDWSLTEMFRQYMVATGAMQEQETFVDYYTHIKGVEYIIAVAFLGLYPAYFKYVNRTKAKVKT